LIYVYDIEEKKEKANTRLFVLVTREAICVFERNKIQGKKVCGLLVLCQENMKKRLLGLICRLIKEQEYIQMLFFSLLSLYFVL